MRQHSNFNFHHVKNLLHISLFLILLLLLSACGGGGSGAATNVAPLSSAKDITGLSFTRAVNPQLNTDANGLISGSNIDVSLPYGVDRSALVPSFSSMAASVQILEFGSVQKKTVVSGVTAINFNSSVTLFVNAADGSTKYYTVNVTNSLPENKEMTTFSFRSSDNGNLTADVPGIFSGKDILVTVPSTADRSKLIAAFTTKAPIVKVNGADQVSGVTANDFSVPITYTVLAADGSSQQYVVRVSNASTMAKEFDAFFINNVVGKIVGNDIYVTLPYGVDKKSLTVTFQTSANLVKVADAVQAPSESKRDFTYPVIYTIVAADGSTKNYTVFVSSDLNNANEITAFSIQGNKANIVGNVISLQLPMGLSRNALAATFTATGNEVKIGEVKQRSDTTVNDFSNPLEYTVVAEDGTQRKYTVIVKNTMPSTKEMLAFSVMGVNATISGNSISLKLPFGANPAALIPTFAMTGNKVTVNNVLQVSAASLNDFSSPVVYKVIAMDGSSQDYLVAVAVDKSKANDISSFSIQGVAATILGSNISISLPANVNRAALVANFTSTGASVKVGNVIQTSGVTPNDFSQPLTYSVYAQDGSIKNYQVTVSLPASSKNTNDMTSFSILGVNGTITGTTITVSLPANTNRQSLLASFTTNGLAVKIANLVQTSGVTINDFSNPVTYTVFAEDGTSKNYVVTIAAISNGLNVVATFDGNVQKAKYNPNCSPVAGQDFIDLLSQSAGKIYPEDCAYSGTNPPVLQWPQGGNNVDTSLALPWTITINKDGRLYATGSSKFSHYQITSALPAGEYDWSVSFRSRTGQTVTGKKRRFTVNSSATAINVVTPDMIVNAAKARSHPRSLPDVAKAVIISRQVPGINSPYDVLVKKAQALALLTPDNEPAKKVRGDFSTDQEYSTWLSSLNTTTDQIVTNSAYLNYVAVLTNDTSMKATAKSRLMSLAGWSTAAGAVSHPDFQDQVARQVLLALAQGYDYLYDDLAVNDRSTIASVINIRLAQMLPLLTDMQILKLNSHGVTNVGFLLNSLLLVAGDSNFPDAEKNLHDAYNVFLVSGTSFGGDDGAFQNGNGYGWYVKYPLETLVNIKSVTTYDLASHPYYAKYLDYLMAFTPPVYNQLTQPFGDDHVFKYFYSAYSFDTLQPFALFTGNRVHQWYYQANPANLTNLSIRPISYFNLIGMGNSAASPLAPTQNNWFFPDAGLASLTSAGDAANRSSIAFRSSKWGSYNHSYADHNSFTMVSKGQDMLISSGYYPRYGSPHAENTRTTRSHNALTFDGGIGQSEAAIPSVPAISIDTTDTYGRLHNGGEANNIAVVTGDAAKAYRRQVTGGAGQSASWTPLLNDAMRSIAYFRGDGIVVIYDWATSTVSRSWELNFHALQPFSLIASDTAKVVNGSSAICLSHYNFPSTMRTSNQFEVPPENGGANQYHLRSTANVASKELVAVTVIKEDCSTKPVSVTFAGTRAQVIVNDRGVEFNQGVVNVLGK